MSKSCIDELVQTARTHKSCEELFKCAVKIIIKDFGEEALDSYGDIKQLYFGYELLNDCRGLLLQNVKKLTVSARNIINKLNEYLGNASFLRVETLMIVKNVLSLNLIQNFKMKTIALINAKSEESVIELIDEKRYEIYSQTVDSILNEIFLSADDPEKLKILELFTKRLPYTVDENNSRSFTSIDILKFLDSEEVQCDLTNFEKILLEKANTLVEQCCEKTLSNQTVPDTISLKTSQIENCRDDEVETILKTLKVLTYTNKQTFEIMLLHMNNIHQHEICSNQSFMSVHSIIDSRLINHILIANLLNYLDVDEYYINLFLKKKALPNILSFSDDTIKSYNDDVDSILCRIPNELQKEKLNRNFIELIVLVDGLTISEIHLLTLLSEYNLEETINLIAEHISILDLMQKNKTQSSDVTAMTPKLREFTHGDSGNHYLASMYLDSSTHILKSNIEYSVKKRQCSFEDDNSSDTSFVQKRYKLDEKSQDIVHQYINKLQTPSRALKKIPYSRESPKQDRTKWTIQEEQTLVKGIQKHGRNWSVILESYKEDFNPCRLPVDLSEKFKRVSKKYNTEKTLFSPTP